MKSSENGSDSKTQVSSLSGQVFPFYLDYGLAIKNE